MCKEVRILCGLMCAAFPDGNPCVLEPVMAVEVTVPEEFQVRRLASSSKLTMLKILQPSLHKSSAIKIP